jgi:hypothetical protein
MAGSLALGLLAGITTDVEALRLIAVGFLGSFTTFSTWMFESQRLAEDGGQPGPQQSLDGIGSARTRSTRGAKTSSRVNPTGVDPVGDHDAAPGPAGEDLDPEPDCRSDLRRDHHQLAPRAGRRWVGLDARESREQLAADDQGPRPGGCERVPENLTAKLRIDQRHGDAELGAEMAGITCELAPISWTRIRQPRAAVRTLRD